MSTHIVCVPTAERGGELKDRIRLLAVVKDIHEGSEAYPNSYPAVIVTVSLSGSDSIICISNINKSDVAGKM